MLTEVRAFIGVQFLEEENVYPSFACLGQNCGVPRAAHTRAPPIGLQKTFGARR